MLPFSSFRPFTRNQHGVTLIELVIAIVIISIAAVALLTSLGFQTTRNTDPMIQSQANALAKQYLDEVLSKPFFDPSGDPSLSPFITQAQAISASTDQSSRTVNSTNRTTWNNIWEYQNFSGAPRRIDGTSINELQAFTVAIAIDNRIGLTLGEATNVANCPAEVVRITVTVTDPRSQSVSLEGYRTSYFNNQSRWPSC